MSVYLVVIVLLCCAVIALSVGVMLMSAKRRTAINIWAGVMLFGAGAWSLLMLLFILQTDVVLAAIYAKAYYLTAIVMAFGLYKFSTHYPIPHKVTDVERVVSWSLVALAAFIVLMPQGVVVHAMVDHMLNAVELDAVWYLVYTAIFAVLVCVAFLRLFLSYRGVRRTHNKKFAHQVLMMTYTLGVVVVAGAYFDIFLPMIGNYGSIWMGPPFTFAFTGYLLYVLATQGIFDVRAALARSVG